MRGGREEHSMENSWNSYFQTELNNYQAFFSLIYSEICPWHLFCCRRIHEPAWSQSAFSHPHHFLWDIPPSCWSPPERECWTGHMWRGTWLSAVWVVGESLSVSSLRTPSKGCVSHWGMLSIGHAALEEANERRTHDINLSKKGVKHFLELRGGWGAVEWWSEIGSSTQDFVPVSDAILCPGLSENFLLGTQTQELWESDLPGPGQLEHQPAGTHLRDSHPEWSPWVFQLGTFCEFRHPG